jgi:ribonuclease VapC
LPGSEFGSLPLLNRRHGWRAWRLSALAKDDCIAYALAKDTGEELLFKGTDFGQTDIAVATY